MSNKTKQKIIAVSMAAAMAVTMVPANLSVKAEVAENIIVKLADEKQIVEVPVTIVDELASSTIVRGTSTPGYNTIHKFTLEKPATVKISLAQDYYKEPILADADAGIYYDKEGTSLVKYSGDIGWIPSEGGKYATTWLEAGTYYVVWRDNGGYYTEGDYVNEEGGTSIGVCAEYVDRSFTGNTKYQKAAVIGMDKDVVGFFSDNNRKQYYKFTLSKASKVTAHMMATKISGTDDYYGRYNAIICDSNMKELVKKEHGKDGTTETISKTLPKGTYYVVMDASASSYYYGITNLKVKASVVKVATPKIVKCKKNTTVISGTATAKATVYVTYNGKTYKATANTSGAYSVKTKVKLKKGKTVKAYAMMYGTKSATASKAVK